MNHMRLLNICTMQGKIISFKSKLIYREWKECWIPYYAKIIGKRCTESCRSIFKLFRLPSCHHSNLLSSQEITSTPTTMATASYNFELKMNFLLLLGGLSYRVLDMLINNAKDCISLKKFISCSCSTCDETMEMEQMEWIGMVNFHDQFSLKQWQFILMLLQEAKKAKLLHDRMTQKWFYFCHLNLYVVQ